MSRISDLLPEDHHRLLIAGRFEDSTGSAVIEVTDPATEDVVAHVPAATFDDALRALDAAEEAARPWRVAAPRERGEILRRAFELMISQRDRLARIIVTENGKTLAEARSEIDYAAEFFRWFSEEAVRWPGLVRTAPGGANRMLVLSEPVGISLLVTPWNAPAAMLTRKVGAALAAGCTTVVKPASETPLIALAIGALLLEAGLPSGVCNIVTARGSSGVIEGLLADGRVRKLSFTGSTEVGQLLLRHAADHVVQCSMELGGNAPFLVLDDADLDAAVAGAMVAKMRNAGISCVAANRFYVAAPLAGEFSARLAEAMGALAVGPGLDESAVVGPMVSAAERDRVAGLVEGAVAGGATVRVGGRRPERPGYFYLPTLVEGVAPGAEILREEIFGPVAPVVAFDDLDEAITQANDTPYGLVGYVYSGDVGRGLAVADRLECGMVGINRGLVSDPAAPFGGVKESGLGREGGAEGLAEYLQTKYVAAAW